MQNFRTHDWGSYGIIAYILLYLKANTSICRAAWIDGTRLAFVLTINSIPPKGGNTHEVHHQHHQTGQAG
jgi:hypothetical protein